MSSASLSVSQPAELCAPPGVHERIWLVHHDDPSWAPRIWRGPRAEASARAYWERASKERACTLLATVPR